MEAASFETAIRLQFDTLAKKVIYCTVKNYEKELGRRAKREKPFSEISEIIIESFSTEDEYESVESIIFNAFGIPILVKEGEISEALKKTSRNEEKCSFVVLFRRVFG